MWIHVFKIRGLSLAPEFLDGDFVVTSGLPMMLRRLKPGDMVVFQRVEYGRLIKRIEHITPCGHIFVQGASADSIDSRTFGPIRPSDVKGKVIWHIHP
jgi:hypothetical protein